MSTCPIPCPESSPTPSHMPKPNASKISSFQNKSLLFLKTHYRILVNTLDYPPRLIAGYFSETVMVLIRSDLLDNSPRQFFRKSSVTPHSRSNLNGGSEPSPGRETIYWDSLTCSFSELNLYLWLYKQFL